VRDAQEALRARDLLFDIFQEVSAALRADEIFQTLVRRVGQAFGLSHCSFVLTAPGDDKGRVGRCTKPRDPRLARGAGALPEIQRRFAPSAVVINDVHEHPLFASIRERWLQQKSVNVQSAVALPCSCRDAPRASSFPHREGRSQLRPRTSRSPIRSRRPRSAPRERGAAVRDLPPPDQRRRDRRNDRVCVA